ncbi:hypothetical protein KI387_023060 [Taxus chinensis]|uniref:WD repeat and HMG-box DNA-binding protein 1 n=1 Tax=Taxus chinensis TaxID=29808 RepID=A0AA38L799_TAXCH|nr:hypothetical protein KI387_023060 [Taxus chinensis]
MKGRSIQLQDAHKHNETESVACILWDRNGKHLITAGADNNILIHSPSSPPSKPITLRHHKQAVTAVAIKSTTLASGSLDHSVKLYSYPGGEFQGNVTRFTLPIRSLAFSKSGELLAAAGDDEGIKLINTIDSSIARVLKAHNYSVTSLAFDPNNEFLASADSDGTVIYWQLSTGKPMHTLKKVAPNTDSVPTCLNQISWRPDGEMLAIPGRKNEVSMYDRDTAEKVLSLKGGHSDIIGSLAWSPNGKYIATSGADCQVMIWEVDRRQDIDRHKFEKPLCSLAWKPNGNALAVIDVLGRFGVWESPVASHMKSPTDGDVESVDDMGFEEKLMSKYEEVLEDSDAGSLDGIGDNSEDDEMGRLPRRVLQKKSSVMVENGEEDNDTIEFNSHRDSLKPKSTMQESFQSGATPQEPGKRSFLSYNMLGSIITFEKDGFSHIEVEFHDIGKGFRVPSMSDYFGFTMASLNESGSVYGSPQKGEKTPSTLMYRPLSSWANNSEWSMRFPIGEEVKAVALGSGWVAAVTSLNFLRVFSEGGLQKSVHCLDGPVITAAGHEDLLVVATHASSPLPSGDQVLGFEVFNVSERTCYLSGRLPISPGSHLTWLGFSEEGLLSSYDSKGNLRVLTKEYNGCWVPLFSADREKKAENEKFWMVGLNNTQVFCVTCKLPDTYPQVSPKPILSVLNLSLPLACSDLGADDLENELLRDSLLLSQMERKAEEAAACSSEIHTENDIFKMEAALDRCLLRLIANCCKGDKLVRATELAAMLSLEKSLQGAIKLANAMKLPMLAERFNALLEDKMLKDSEESIAYKKSISNGAYFDSPVHLDAKQITFNANPGDNPHFPHPEVKPNNASLEIKANHASLETKPNHATLGLSKHNKRTEVDTLEVIRMETNSVQSEGKKSVDSQVQPELNNGPAQKPSNPFAKASNASANQAAEGNVSLFNSIKQMKSTTENEGKRKDRAGTGCFPKKPSKQAKKK